jgi:SAM-dependent methyltransferase
MTLPDDSVDGVLCRWGYMLMAAPEAALAETRRVLRDGGRLCLSVWGPPDENEWAALSRRALVEGGHAPAPQPGEPGIFAMASEERIRELVTGAGFETVDVEPVPVEYRFEDFDAYWSFLEDMAGGIALVLDRLSEDELAQLRESMRRKVEPLRSNGGYLMPGVALNAVAS